MVRNATAGDIPALIELGARMYIESRYSQNSPFDEEKRGNPHSNFITCRLPAGGEKDDRSNRLAGRGLLSSGFSRQLMAFGMGCLSRRNIAAA